MNHSRTVQDVRDDMRLCIIKSCETPDEGKRELHGRYMELERELALKERQTHDLELAWSE